MKKVLILTVSAGNGHNAIAQALKQKLVQEDENNIVEVVDILKSYSSKFYFWETRKGYALDIGLLPTIYDYFYKKCKITAPNKRYKNFAQKVSSSVSAGLLKKIYDFKPDVIYCSHFYAALAISDLRLCYNIPSTVIVSSLDYVNSPYWEGATGVDFFTLPHKDFMEENIKNGFKESQLIATGIPVDEKFFVEPNKKAAKKSLGLDENTFTALLMFGGGEWAGAFRIFKMLVSSCKNEKLQIIVCNGRNKSSFKKVEQTKVPENIKVVNLGFSNEIHKYMAASDIAVTKAGGVSVTEMLNSQVPILITHKVYGQEFFNMNYLVKCGVAEIFRNEQELFSLVKKYQNKDVIEQYKENVKQLRKNGMQNIEKLILSQKEAKFEQSYENIDYSSVLKNVRKQMKIMHKKLKKEQK